jgi:predicted Fe-S protein YdhL (DUF1289 family)
MNGLNRPTNSPCIRNCCLDHQDICLGCYRHIDEIINWTKQSPSQQQAILKQCEERKRASNKNPD